MIGNLREHYALTLEEWLRRLEDKHAAAVEMVGEEHYRTSMYMSASAYGFRRGKLSCFRRCSQNRTRTVMPGCR